MNRKAKRHNQKPRNPTKPYIDAHFPHAVRGMCHIYTDGCCQPNPGRAGWAFIAYKDGAEVARDSGNFAYATNNVAELTGLLRSLEWIVANSNHEKVTVFTDSMYSVQGATQWMKAWKSKGWARGGEKAKEKNRVLANAELWKAIDIAMTLAPNAAIRWCKGHSGIRGNEAADRLAWQAMERAEERPVVEANASPENQDWLTAEYRLIMRDAS